jgi:hypothetical protein
VNQQCKSPLLLVTAGNSENLRPAPPSRKNRQNRRAATSTLMSALLSLLTGATHVDVVASLRRNSENLCSLADQGRPDGSPPSLLRCIRAPVTSVRPDQVAPLGAHRSPGEAIILGISRVLQPDLAISAPAFRWRAQAAGPFGGLATVGATVRTEYWGYSVSVAVARRRHAHYRKLMERLGKR